MTTRQDLEREALKIDKELRAAFAQIDARRDLSEHGKAAEKHLAQQKQAARVEALREQARQLYAGKATKAQKSLDELRRLDFDDMRASLGDAVLSDIYRRRLQVRTAAEITAWIDQSTDGFERNLLRALAQAELESRVMTSENPDRFEWEALGKIDAALQSPEISAAETVVKKSSLDETWLQELDVAAWRTSFADRLRLDADSVLTAPHSFEVQSIDA